MASSRPATGSAPGGGGTPGWRVREVAITASTNADLVAAVHAGDALPGDVLLAYEQTAGRGRLGRDWSSRPGAGLTASIVLPLPATGWFPLAAGVAVAQALTAATGLAAQLKWPNDVLLDGRKVAGLLAEAVPPVGVVLGIGLNLTATEAELPGPQATSVSLAGGPALSPRQALTAVLTVLDAHRAQPVTLADYRALSVTAGNRVRLELPDGSVITGVADIADDGRLVIDGHGFTAGDVVHLRPLR